MVEKKSSGDLADDCAGCVYYHRAGVDVLRRPHSARHRELLRFRPDVHRRVEIVAMAARARLCLFSV